MFHRAPNSIANPSPSSNITTHATKKKNQNLVSYPLFFGLVNHFLNNLLGHLHGYKKVETLLANFIYNSAFRQK